MLLEQANTRLQSERDLLANALARLRHRDGCFCEMSIGNPMYREHTQACEKATHALAVVAVIGYHGNQVLSGASGSAQSEAP